MQKNMSGHSKFHNIKKTKDKADAARAKIFTKIGREIAVAVKLGGPDPNTNSKLADIISKAKSNNMPNDNIQRSIKKASGETNMVDYTDMVYEGYGPAGVAFIVECLTDNKNRTAGDVRHLFDKSGGSLGTTGSVSFMFNRKGVVVIEKKDGLEEDKIFEIAIESGADDVVTDEDCFTVYTPTQSLKDVHNAFTEAGIEVMQAESEMVPSNYIVPSEDQIASIEKLIDGLEELDDVQNVYHNADF